MKKNNLEPLIKSKSRVRDHGEVFTPDFIVEDMLNLVDHETQRLESRFLEPACGDGNFLIKVLERKINVVTQKYKKIQLDYEKYVFTSVASIYGIDLLVDNIEMARERLYEYVAQQYKSLYKKKGNQIFLDVIKEVLQKNLVQGDALTLKDQSGEAIHFIERSFVGYKVKRREYIFEELIDPNTSQQGDNLFVSDQSLYAEDGKKVFLPQSIQEYPLVYFLDLLK